MTDVSNQVPAYSLPVYRAADFGVIEGANLGDALSFAADLVLDDIYGLRPGAETLELAIQAATGKAYRIATSSPSGRPGAVIHLDCTLTLMTPRRQNHRRPCPG